MRARASLVELVTVRSTLQACVQMTPEQIESFPYGDWDKQHDLGDDHWYAFVSCGDGCPGEGHHGIIQPHLHPNGNWCGGAITFVGHNAPKRADGSPGHVWTLVSVDPLEMEPSLLCTMPGCGDHGFIRGGRWVRA